jgi:hypothetical protein
MLKHNFFLFFIIFNASVLAMQEEIFIEEFQTEGYKQHQQYQPKLQKSIIIIPNKPQYKNLENKFGSQTLKTVLYNYQNNIYVDQFFQQWSNIADCAIGCAEQKRYFLVNVMLHAQNHWDGLDALYQVLSCSQSHTKNNFNTPQGSICAQLSSSQYTEAMKVCNDIRATMFGGNIKPLILVEKSSVIVPVKIKWSLFKGLAIISYLVTSCLTKEDDNKDKKKKHNNSNNSLFSFLALSDTLQKVEKNIQKGLENSYPVLKTHVVKSLVDDTYSWIYDINNWIFYGSIGCMALLLLCLFRGHLPHMYRTVTFLIIT